MTIQRQDLSFPAYNSQVINLTLKDGDVAVDLTGKSVLFKMSPQIGGDALIQKNEGAGVTIPVPANGQIAVAIGPGDIPDGGVYWFTVDVRVGNPVTSQTRYYEGRVVVTPSPAPQA
jgi:hypothetical protein